MTEQFDDAMKNQNLFLNQRERNVKQTEDLSQRETLSLATFLSDQKKKSTQSSIMNFLSKTDCKERKRANPLRDNKCTELKKKVFLCENIQCLDSADMREEQKYFVSFLKKSQYPFILIGSERKNSFVQKFRESFHVKEFLCYKKALFHLLFCVLVLENNFTQKGVFHDQNFQSFKEKFPSNLEQMNTILRETSLDQLLLPNVSLLNWIVENLGQDLNFIWSSLELLSQEMTIPMNSDLNATHQSYFLEKYLRKARFSNSRDME